ncbi:MAG: hydrogenase maturation nickel metallochaperone HypA [Gammaproteobacteria bacterium]|nr:hydrogenase maturation nickel metallochaperone HypA [Gammaproteobacteria bacterium]
MHEISLCQAILQIIEEQSVLQNFVKVNRVNLEFGALAVVDEQALRFAFDVVKRDSIAEAADLHIIHLAAQAKCLLCMKMVNIKQRFDACPDCGSYELQVHTGDELRVKALEVE